MNRRLLAMAAAAAFLVAAVAVPGSAAADGCARTGPYTVCRTDPQGAKDTAIVAEVVRQINGAGQGDKVRAAVYQWTMQPPIAPVAEALVAARQRGADVRAVVGRRSDRPDMNDPVIERLQQAGIDVHQCEDGCLPNANGTTNGPDHNRFFLVEQGGAPTVLVTSFSFTRSHLTQAHNLLGVHGDRALFDFYEGFWDRLHAENWNRWTGADKGVTGSLARSWVFPRVDDPVVQQLKALTACEPGDRVLVGHANFQTNRPAVRAQLDRIQGLGCQVRVIVHDIGSNDPSWIEDALGRRNVRVHEDLRSKFIVAEAQFGERHRSMVWTGTHNLTGNAMKHADDNLLRVADEGVANLYAQFFQQLWSGAS
jgi:phosphatidylserine/phosphatidylglycerophosphate/cardiolipin synthase-like enzyme